MESEKQKFQFSHSLALYNAAREVISGGVNSNVRLWEKPHPLFLESGEGPYLFDVDGNRLIDYVMGQGPMLLGHRPSFIIKAVEEQLRRGILYGAQHRLEIEVAQLVTEMVPSAEVVRFNMTGTEAVQAALRVARAATGRDRIVKFEGHYHGWVDNVLFNVGSGSDPADGCAGLKPVPESSGIAEEAAASLLVIPWNDINALEDLFSQFADSIAAVIMEPVMANSGVIEPASGYLEAVRKSCHKHDIVLIFDEVITGFRVHPGGAQGRYGVTPDLTTMGKALASGFPIGCLAGKRELMDGIATGAITHAGTFNATPISMAAALASLEHLNSGGNEWYADLEARGQRLMRGFDEILSSRNLPHIVQGPPTIFNLMFTDQKVVKDHADVRAIDHNKRDAFLPYLMEAGIRFSGRGNVFMSDSHTTSIVDETLNRFDCALTTFTTAS